MCKKGYKQTEEHRIKVIESIKRSGVRVGRLKGCIAWNKGLTKETDERVRHSSKPRTEETKRKIGLANKGKKFSEERKNKMKETMKKNWQDGKLERVFSDERKLKMSLASKGKPKSEEHKQHLRKPKSDTSKMKGNRIFPSKNTKEEVKIQNLLKQLEIEFFTHQYMEIQHGFKCDILIPSFNTIIECDGDFMHCNPLKYPPNFIRFPTNKKIKTAQEIWEIDRLRTQELKEKDFNVIRLWESEIQNLDLNKFKEILKKQKNEIRI
jgi:G:T-mismatch repair DNA endonuclease (very short patch repair protein)